MKTLRDCPKCGAKNAPAVEIERYGGLIFRCEQCDHRWTWDPAEEATTSDGSTASYYELPQGATELQHLISYKNMNAQIGEIFRATYRYGVASHSDQQRDIKKILFYAQAELERLEKYERNE